MKLFLCGHGFRYAMEQIQLALFPGESVEYTEVPFPEGEDGAVSTLRMESGRLAARTEISLGGRTGRAELSEEDDGSDASARRLLRQSYYRAALPLLEAEPAWGALSGVRPGKLATRHFLSGGTDESADAMLRDVYSVSESRRKLCLEAGHAALDALSVCEERDLALYVGIPFCPTRCAYCSFVSTSIEKYTGLLEPYLEALTEEITDTGARLKASGRRLRAIYIGGGTPTTLSAPQLERLMDAIREHLPMEHLTEYTVEAGRPDTVDPEKLSVLRAGGADRISINPQTMQDSVLRAVGRQHSAARTLAAFSEAADVGFGCVNADLIAGLPTDTPAGFRDSLLQVLDRHPENITVHTLALKKGAELFFRRESLPSGAEVAEMLDFADETLRRAGYVPYYLYRQKYMSGSFENIGWTLPGHSCLYNILMMEELRSVAALGGGGVSKTVHPVTGRIQRFSNPKYPREYIERPEVIRSRKAAFFEALAAM